MNTRASRGRWAAVVIVAGLALVPTLAAIDVERLVIALASLGPFVPFLLLPFLVATSLDVLGSGILLERTLGPAGFLALLRVRLMAEAVGQSLPTGSLLADGLTPCLLKDHCGIPWSEGIANVALRKGLLLAAQATFLAFAAAAWAIGMATRPGTLGLALAALLAAATILLVLSGLVWLVARGSPTARLAVRTPLVPSRLVRLWVARRRVAVREIALQLRRVVNRGEGERGLRCAFPAYVAMCVVEFLEAFWLLRLLGSPLGLVEVLPLEAVLSWLRAVAFFVPAGLGIQDLGGVALLHAAGVPEAGAIGAGWAVLRRVREAFWIGVGYVLLARRHRTLA